MKLNFSYGLLGIRLLDHVFPGAGEMGFPVISEMLLISIISFQFPASTSIFMNAVVVSLSPGFLLCKGMAVLSDTKHQAMPYWLKLFWKAFRKCCTFGYSKKLSTELFGVLTLGNRHFFMHVKRLYDDEMTE